MTARSSVLPIGHNSYTFYPSYGDGVADLMAVCINNDITRPVRRELT